MECSQCSGPMTTQEKAAYGKCESCWCDTSYRLLGPSLPHTAMEWGRAVRGRVAVNVKPGTGHVQE
jgi:hypothetical protein